MPPFLTIHPRRVASCVMGGEKREDPSAIPPERIVDEVQSGNISPAVRDLMEDAARLIASVDEQPSPPLDDVVL